MRRRVLLVPIVLALSAGVSIGAAPSSGAVPTCSGWSLAPLTQPGSLNAAKAFAPDDMVVAGTEVYHWDGTSWTQMGVPDLPGIVWGIDGTDMSDLWMGGEVPGGFQWTRGFIGHRQGPGSWEWRELDFGWDSGPIVTGVAQGGPQEAWAATEAGTYHWAHASLTGPEQPSSAVDAISEDDVWAVGTDGYPEDYVAISHWDGTSWQNGFRRISGINGQLWGVSALSHDDVWAVGLRYGRHIDRTLILHWNGAAWQRYRSPNIHGMPMSQLTSVAASGPDDVIAVGWGGSDWTSVDPRQLILHWDGHTWSKVAPPMEAGAQVELWGASALPTGEKVVVGTRLDTNPDQIVIETYCPT